MLKINSHIHTPYSFSAFKSIEEAFQLADEEGIKVLGINDFFVTDGYKEFMETAEKYRIYPLFNIEFIGLLKDEQQNGIRVNDPSNPGRTYFCGKALKNPPAFSYQNKKKLNKVIHESQVQVKEMLKKLTVLLDSINAPFSLNYDDLKKNYARELVRERHIAQGLRNAINEHFSNPEAKLDFVTNLYSGEAPKADINSNSSFEGELRSRLLKAGGAAFVAEDESSFLPIPELVDIIIDAGGIPCYPVLLDDKNGSYTEFEVNKEALLKRLTQLKVGAVELIPGRNNIEHLRSFVSFFHKNGFLVSFGTEHNSPEMIPLEVKAGGGTMLDDFLLKINEEAAFVYISHQERIKKGEEGYIDLEGQCKNLQKADFIEEGKSIFKKFLDKPQNKNY